MTRALKWIRLFGAFVCLFENTQVHAADLRLAEVQWRAIEGAVAYELELSSKYELDPVLIKQRTQLLSVGVKLAPGVYYFRVRGVDQNTRPGPWSEVQGFQVHGAPPVAVFPPHMSTFSQRLPKTGMVLKWKSTTPEVAVEVSDTSGKVLERTVKGDAIAWMPGKPGLYEWRVGTVTAVGVDWSKSQIFQIRDTALSSTVLAAALFSLDEAGYPEIYENGREGEWGVMARVSQSLLLWDAGLSSPNLIIDSSSNFVGSGSLEVRRRFPRSATETKLFTVLANVEFLREVVGSESIWVPRGYTQLHMTIGSPSFRWGPLVRFGAGSGLIVVPNSTGGVRYSEQYFRWNGSLGAIAVMAASPKLYFTIAGLARLDFGGTSVANSITLLPTVGYEANLGLQWFFTPALSIELRFRAQGEFYKWAAPIPGTTPDPNYFGNTFIFLDAGFGFRF